MSKAFLHRDTQQAFLDAVKVRHPELQAELDR